MPSEPDPHVPSEHPSPPGSADDSPAAQGSHPASTRGRSEPRDEVPGGIDDPRRFERLETVKRLGLEFQERFYGTAIERLGARAPWLAERAFALSELGRYSESLELDREVVACEPEDPTARYNLACSLCLSGDLEGALDELEAALSLGYRDRAFLAEDPDLEALHGHPRFDALLTR